MSKIGVIVSAYVPKKDKTITFVANSLVEAKKLNPTLKNFRIVKNIYYEK
jgi:hypothetical protein